MKAKYDFSKAERGKFYRPDIELNIPVYLDPDVARFIQDMARTKELNVTALVNQWLRQDIALLEERTVGNAGVK